MKVKGCLTFINATYFKIISAESIVLLFLKKQNNTFGYYLVCRKLQVDEKIFPLSIRILYMALRDKGSLPFIAFRVCSSRRNQIKQGRHSIDHV